VYIGFEDVASLYPCQLDLLSLEMVSPEKVYKRPFFDGIFSSDADLSFYRFFTVIMIDGFEFPSLK